MSNKLYVGNLAFATTEDQIAELFAQFGTVDSVNLITDRDTGRSKGFAFVEMSSREEAQEAISQLDGSSLDGRPLTVNEARPKVERSGGGGFGGPRGGRDGGGRSGGGRGGRDGGGGGRGRY